MFFQRSSVCLYLYPLFLLFVIFFTILNYKIYIVLRFDYFYFLCHILCWILNLNSFCTCNNNILNNRNVLLGITLTTSWHYIIDIFACCDFFVALLLNAWKFSGLACFLFRNAFARLGVAREIVQWVRELALQTWGPEFESQDPHNARLPVL